MLQASNKIQYQHPNLIVKIKAKQEARSARVKKVLTIVYRDTHGKVFWDNDATKIVGVHNY